LRAQRHGPDVQRAALALRVQVREDVEFGAEMRGLCGCAHDDEGGEQRGLGVV
tara:strand:+ start:29688 stop:29846 length:159 start_codon:yes stop_codon:yes gene_type:complete